MSTPQNSMLMVRSSQDAVGSESNGYLLVTQEKSVPTPRNSILIVRRSQEAVCFESKGYLRLTVNLHDDSVTPIELVALHTYTPSSSGNTSLMLIVHNPFLFLISNISDELKG